MSCSAPIAWSQLVDYWAADLPADDEARIEEHLFGCAACSAEAARVAAIGEGVRAILPPVLTGSIVEQLRARGRRVRESRFAPGDRREERFAKDDDLLVFHLGGLDLSRASRVELALRDEDTGALLVTERAAPFDAQHDAVLLCCQRHYASLPPNVVAEVRVHADDGERTTTYGIRHVFE